MNADKTPIMVDLAREADFSLGSLRVRPSLRQVEGSGESETLEPRVMQVLVALGRRCGEVVSRDELVQSCWGGRIVGEDAISRAIARVRKLGEASGAFGLETIPRVGYRLVETGADESRPPNSIPEKASDGRWASLLRRPHNITIGLLLVAAIGAGALLLANTGERTGDVVRQQRIAFFGVEAQSDEVSAVAATATDEIYKSLDKAGLEMSAHSATQDAAANRLVRARELGALYALSGQARIDGDQIIAYLRLEDTHSSTTLWEESLAASRGSMQNLPVQMGTLASRRLGCITRLRVGLQVNDVETARLLPRACSSTDGENLALWRTMGKRAPNSAPILAGMASNLSFAAVQLPDASRATMLVEAEQAAQRALQLDPKLGSAHNAKFLVARAKGEPLANQQAILEAGLAVAPDDTWLRLWYGNHLSKVGRISDALPSAAMAASSDPVFFWKPINHARWLAIAGRSAEAARVFQDSVFHTPSVGWRYWMYAAAFGNAGTSGAPLTQAPSSLLLPDEVECWREVESAVRSRDPARLSLAAEAVSACLAKGSFTEEMAFLTFAGLGDFERAFAQPDPPVAGEVYYPFLKGLRAHPKFVAFVENNGTLDYWKSTGTRPDFCKTENAPVCEMLK